MNDTAQSTFKKLPLFDIVLLAISISIFIVLSWPLRGWLIDDAGISFAYAKNIASGYGMISQPGMPPVEGISNPLWTFSFVPFFWTGLFKPILIAKGVSLLFVLVSFVYALKISNRLTNNSRWSAILTLCGFVFSAPIIIWCSSGLENPLYLACVLGLLWVCLRSIDSIEILTKRWSIIAGVLTAAAALTRPEGVLLVVLFPAAILSWWVFDRKLQWHHVQRTFIHFLFSFVLIFGGYLLFRILYFADWFPNTYYVKGGPDRSEMFQALALQGEYLVKLRDISGTLIGSKAWLILPVISIISLTSIVFFKKRRTESFIAILALLIACFTYLIMTQDWMGEYRFGVTIYPLFYLCFAALLFEIFTHVFTSRKIVNVLGWIAAGLLLVGVWRENHRRLDAFIAHPPTSFFTVAERFGKQFNEYAKYLSLDSASVLLPDIGGTLMYSDLRVYDLGGLCDKTIAKTRGHDQTRFYNYVFDTLKPTFIHTHGYFTAVSAFDDDPRFLREYEPITQSTDEYVQRVYKTVRISGDFIRRDAVIDKAAKLDSLRSGKVHLDQY